MKDRFPKIVDATLREGAQAPGVFFSPNASVSIAKQLEDLGVDMVECGHPIASPAELERCRCVVEATRLPVLCHARCRMEDVNAVVNTGASWVGIFIGINDLSRSAKLKGSTIYEVLDAINASVKYARSCGLQVRFTLEDASRTPMSQCITAYRMAVEAGANRLCYADTVGCSEPSEIVACIGALRKTFPSIELEGHFHNDRGLATANSLAAIDAGVDWVSTSINGLGERSGITDLSVFLANLHFRGQRSINKPEAMVRVSKLVAALARSPVPSFYPVVGEHAFTHTARLHQRAMLVSEKCYSWMPPADLGRSTEFAAVVQTPSASDYVVTPRVIPSSELRFHTDGVGNRFVLIDDRFVPNCRQYCIVRTIPPQSYPPPAHVERHVHRVDSLFVFLGVNEDLTGLSVDVQMDYDSFVVESPVSVFIPSGVRHSYRILSGSGLFFNHVLAGKYNESLLEVNDI